MSDVQYVDEDPVETLRKRGIAVKEAADQMVLSYGQMVYNRGAIEERLRQSERTVYDLKGLLAEGVSLTPEEPKRFIDWRRRAAQAMR